MKLWPSTPPEKLRSSTRTACEIKNHQTVQGRFPEATSSGPTTGQAREAYRLFQRDPFQRGLRFKRVHPEQPIYSVRVGRDYRAVGVRKGDEIVWYWIGSHSDYDKLLSRS